MNKYVKLFFKIKIHTLTLVLIILSILSARFVEIILLLAIVLIHELGHAFTAVYFNWKIRHIAILPFGGQLETEEYGNRSTFEEFMVTLAGPLQHVLLFFVLLFFHQMKFLDHDHYQMILELNIMVLLTNLFPAWPLDGGKLLFLWISRFVPFIQAHKIILVISTVFLIGFSFLVMEISANQFSSWMLIAFIGFSTWKEKKQQRYYFLRMLFSREAKKMPCKQITVDASEKIVHVINRFYKDFRHEFIIVKDQQIIGKVDERVVLASFIEKNLWDPIEILLK